MSFLSDNTRRNTILDSDFVNWSIDNSSNFCYKVRKAAIKRAAIKRAALVTRAKLQRLLTEIDRRYFHLMTFAVVRLPQVFISVVCVQLVILYEECSAQLTRKRLTQQRLRAFFENFCQLETIHMQLERTYSLTILIIVAGKLTLNTVKSYLLFTYISQTSETGGSLTGFVFGAHVAQSRPDQLMCQAKFAVTSLGVVLNFFFNTSFLLCCVYCNETVSKALFCSHARAPRKPLVYSREKWRLIYSTSSSMMTQSRR